MSIKQFSGRYLLIEDRLVFRITTTDDLEYRFLLTRHVTRDLLVDSRLLLTELVALQYPGTASTAMARFIQDALRQRTDLAQSYVPSAQQPLGKAPVMVLDTSHVIDTRDSPPQVMLRFKLANLQDAEFRLPLESLQRMQLLLEQLQERAAWDLQLTPDRLTPTALAGDSSVLH